MKTTITITGTHCPSCKALIEDVCRDIPGVISCDVDYTTGKTDIEHTELFSWDAFDDAVASVGGYRVSR